MTADTLSDDTYSAPLTHSYHALESSRDSGFDLAASAGEIVDNSLEANASIVRIKMVESEEGSEVVKMAFADDGDGIVPEILAQVLSLGYSNRYNSRNGYGRFGMGLKLASLAQGKCVEVYTRPKGELQVYHTGLNLIAVREGLQTELRAELASGLPDEFAGLMTDPATGEEFESGTLVIWSDIDRLPTGKSAQASLFDVELNARRDELHRFLARAYRLPLSEGRRIELDGELVRLYDPTFQLSSPRMVATFGKNIPGEIIDSKVIEIGSHEVKIVVTLSPPETRERRGQGGRQFPELFLSEDNARAISMLRNGREIYYDTIFKMLPGALKDNDLDRFIGVEISFPAELDEYFQVRNVKRGADPVPQVRAEIRNFIAKPVETARKRIRAVWDATEKSTFNGPADKRHERALATAQRAQENLPARRPQSSASEEEIQESLETVAEDYGIDPALPESQPVLQRLRADFDARPLMIADAAWPGKDMFDIDHLSGKFILKINHRHPFIAKVYDRVKAAAQDGADLSTEELKDLIGTVDLALEVLLMAYGMAENSHNDPDTAYGHLRSYWGQFTAAFITEALKD